MEQAFDGPTAVDLAAAVRPDVVLLDVMLPGFDGLEVCRRIQADRPVPVLMLTARDDEADVLVGLGVGADDYLTKPFSMREVVAREADSWPAGEPFALHPRMQAVTLEVILRAVFGVSDPAHRERLGERLGELLAGTSSAGLQFGVLLSRRFGGPDPLAKLAALRQEIDAMLGAEIAARRADPGEDILSLLGPPASRTASRWTTPRSATS